jgi:hypothetical protein
VRKQSGERRGDDQLSLDRGEQGGGAVPAAASCRQAAVCHCGEGTRKSKRSSAASRQGSTSVTLCPQLIFEIITKIPLKGNSKLLSKILKKLKIYKNKSCSTFQTLQLSQ